MLVEGFGFGWGETFYSGVTFPLVEPGLRHAVKLGFPRIIVFPYFLFTGVLVSRIYRHAERVAQDHPEIEFINAPYLNDHPLVIETFRDRVAQILEGDNRMNCGLLVPGPGAGLRGRGRVAADEPSSPCRGHRRRLSSLRGPMHRRLPGAGKPAR